MLYLESRGRDMTPVKHTMEFRPVFHISFECRQKYLRGVTKYNDS